jgi:predicted permease membrane protein
MIITGVGYFIGQIQVRQIPAGRGRRLAAVVISHVDVTIDNGVKAVTFAVFIFEVGYDSGAGFFNSLNRKTLREIAMAVFLRGQRARHGAALREAVPSEQGAGRGARGRCAYAVGDYRHRGRCDRASGPLCRRNENAAIGRRDRVCGDLCVRLARRDHRVCEPAAEVYGARPARGGARCRSRARRRQAGARAGRTRRVARASRARVSRRAGGGAQSLGARDRAEGHGDERAHSSKRQRGRAFGRRGAGKR